MKMAAPASRQGAGCLPPMKKRSPDGAGSRPAAGEGSRVEDNGDARRNPSAAQAGGGQLHLIVGPVGAGKSTWARKLASRHRGVHFDLDEWMAVLFRPDRPDTGLMPWYAERAARLVDQIWNMTQRTLAADTDAVLEIGLLTRAEREGFFSRVDAAGLPLSVYVLDAERDVRRRRVERRNETQGSTFTTTVPPAIFELASDLWEPLESDECEGRDVRFFRTDVGKPGV